MLKMVKSFGNSVMSMLWQNESVVSLPAFKRVKHSYAIDQSFLGLYYTPVCRGKKQNAGGKSSYIMELIPVVTYGSSF